MKWAYGVTTVPERFETTLPRTLKSLAAAGFDQPYLFVDGGNGYYHGECCEDITLQTLRVDRVRTVGNWIMAAWELLIRNPTAERFAIFQDDLVTYRNLRQYLERLKYPSKGYINLYTFPENEKPTVGLHPTNQLGRGAVGLVFSQDALRVLLAQPALTAKVTDTSPTLTPPLTKGQKNLDGCIVNSMLHAGWKEYTHSPTLVQHTDDGKSTMMNKRHEQAVSFLGEGYDALRFITETQPVRRTNRRIGLVGYHCNNTYGEMNRQLAKYLEIDSWLILPHHEMNYRTPPADIDCTICYTGRYDKVDNFVRKVDSLLFVGNPQYPTLLDSVRNHGKRAVCIALPDEPTPETHWLRDVHLVICNNQEQFEQLREHVPCAIAPWPVDIEEVPYVGYLGETVDMDNPEKRHEAEMARWSARKAEIQSLTLDGSHPHPIVPKLVKDLPCEQSSK